MAAPREDPYFVVRDAVGAGLAEALAAAPAARAGAARGEPEGPARLLGLLGGLPESLRELGMAVEVMDLDPGKFRLTREDVAIRRGEYGEMERRLSALSDEAQKLQAQAAAKATGAGGGGGVAAGRGARLSGGSPAAALHSEADERFQQHLMLMREQDDELDALGDQARRVGHIGREIGGELELQGQILDKLEDETDVTRNRLRGVTSKVSDLLKKNDKCQWIVAGVLLLLLILLTIALFH